MLHLYEGVLLQKDVIEYIFLITEYFYFYQGGKAFDSAEWVIFPSREFG